MWFALGCLAVAVQAQSGKPTRAQASRFLGKLDRLFDLEQYEKYRESFREDLQPVFKSELHTRLDNLQLLKGLRAKSSIVKFFTRGSVGVALVDTKYSSGSRSIHITTFVGIERRNSQTVGRFAIEVDAKRAQAMQADRDVFSCRACNYEIRFDDTWLAAPVLPSRSGCMESVWLISMRHNLHIEAAVQIANQAAPADQVMTACINSARGPTEMRSEPDAKPEKWQPRRFDNRLMPAGMSSIRSTRHCKQGQCAQLNLIVMGRLRYLFVVRGSDEVLEQNRATVERVLDSFRLLDPTLTARSLAMRATLAHTGAGDLRPDNSYTNEKYKVSIHGPSGWTSSIRAGAWLFQLTYRCPKTGAYLNVRALPPLGSKWSTGFVDGTIDKGIVRGNRKIRSETRWKKNTATGFEWRRLLTSSPDKTSTDHIAHYAVRPNMLVILDGSFPNPAARELIQKAIDSLRTLK